MKAFVTSIGEPTTELCIWSLKRNGFDVELVQDKDTSLAQKLKYIYETATDDFFRVDADVVVNKKCTPDTPFNNWWTQYQCWDWWKQSEMYGGIQRISKDCLPTLRNRVNGAMSEERPETYLSRVAEFYNPRRFSTIHIVLGLHGYKQNDMDRVKATKQRRGQIDDYDFELADRLLAL